MASLRQLYGRRLTAPGLKEGIREPLYDFLTLESGATSALRFFQTPISGVKTKADTNMTLAGALPAGWKFVVEVIEVHVLPGSNADSYVRQDPVRYLTALAAPEFANDVWAVVSKAYLEITIGSKPYLTAPLLEFPSCTGLIVNSAAAIERRQTTAADAQDQVSVDYARLAGSPYVVNPVLPLPGQTNFDVTLNWGAALTMPSGFDARIGVVLRGIRFRDA